MGQKSKTKGGKTKSTPQAWSICGMTKTEWLQLTLDQKLDKLGYRHDVMSKEIVERANPYNKEHLKLHMARKRRERESRDKDDYMNYYGGADPYDGPWGPPEEKE